MPFFSRSKAPKKSSPPSGPAKPKPAPYRHVPTHAASDSMAMTPSSSRSSERAAIQDANRKRMSRNNSSQSLAAYASSNSLLRRNSSGHTSASAPAGGPIMSVSSSSYRHPGYAAYEMFDSGSSSVPKVNSRKVGKSPLSSPPMSPVDGDARSDGNGSHCMLHQNLTALLTAADSIEASLDLDAPRKEPSGSSTLSTANQSRSRHHSRKGSTAVKLPVRANSAITKSEHPSLASTLNLSPSHTAAPGTAPAPVPKRIEPATSVAPVAAASASNKRRSRFSFFGSKSSAIAAH
ncbi:MAG: hypothetical protein MMC23_007907 [Stictis urceolatum]|nr:hypothetical protein [Stictis urceolata]